MFCKIIFSNKLDIFWTTCFIIIHYNHKKVFWSKPLVKVTSLTHDNEIGIFNGAMTFRMNDTLHFDTEHSNKNDTFSIMTLVTTLLS